jgi:hypothetical protein
VTSQLLDQSLGAFPNSIPNPKSLAGLFGTAPIPPGFYGENWSSTIFITTNHRSELVKLGQMNALALTILALEAGGYSLEAAVVLGAVSSVAADKALADLEKQNPPLGGRILVPHILASNFKWEDGSHIGHWVVVVVPSDKKKLAAFLQQEHNPGVFKENHLPSILRRLITGMMLLGGQAILLAIPLLVFGWQALIIGLGALLLSTLVLALAWKILPGRGWLKGLLAGGILALASVLILTFVLGTGIFPAFGLFLSTFWMGIVFSGTRP